MIKHFYFYALTCGVPEARYRSFFPIAYSCLPIMVTKELEHGPDHPKRKSKKSPSADSDADAWHVLLALQPP